jgi:hypothetical protein
MYAKTYLASRSTCITEVYSGVPDVLQKRHGIRAQFGDSILERFHCAKVG